MSLRAIYANTKESGFTINFFHTTGASAKVAALAAPFFNTTMALDAITSPECKISLIVRFSPITTPAALREALKRDNVKIRYFTDAKFHSKLYIVDDAALVGSANLTKSGLESNRELSVLLTREHDESFEDVKAIFEELWNAADVLNHDVLKSYERAFNKAKGITDEISFEDAIKNEVPTASVPSIVVGSNEYSKERTFIQDFRRKYDESLAPAFKELKEHLIELNFGRSEFSEGDIEIEIGRFLGWLRAISGSGENWRSEPVLDKPGREERIKKYCELWHSSNDSVYAEMEDADWVIDKIKKIRNELAKEEILSKLTFDEILDCLVGCMAFLDRLRFVRKSVGVHLSGEERLRKEFKEINSLESVVRTINFLFHGRGSSIERAYDCINGEYRLKGFGESCVMELFGWANPDYPPLNNRSIKGLRFLGFDVEDHVVGAE